MSDPKTKAAPTASKGAAPAASKAAGGKGAAPASSKGAAPGSGKGAKPAASKGTAPAASKGASKKAAQVASKVATPKASKESVKKVASSGKVVKKKLPGRARNWSLKSGVYMYSRSKMYHRKALYKFVGKKTPKKVRPKKTLTIVKKIGGEKNGGTRTVLLKKRRKNYPTADPVKKRPSRKLFSKHRRYVRRSIQSGTVCILVAGPHKGKRVVCLKVLKTGLLLVNGPFKVNGCPLRRVNQNYVIATSTRLDISKAQIPKHLVDDYFKRVRPKKVKKEGDDIFSTKKEKYKPSEQRKADQKVLDKLVIDAIKKHPDKKILFSYLSSMFGLRSSQYPHRMKF